MNLPHRISLLVRLGEYLLANEPSWKEAKTRAQEENGWFTDPFMDHAVAHIARHWLNQTALESWAADAALPTVQSAPKTVGVVMAGNLPLVGFHDWLSVFLSGHRTMAKLSSKDQVLLSHLFEQLQRWEPAFADNTQVASRLQGADAYIATGSNNSSRYFSYYFGKYPHIIRKNRTAGALLTGQETEQDLEGLADDIHLYFGMGCRNVTKLFVPVNYDFIPLLNAFKKYAPVTEHHKYKNNYDYQLALHILNKKYYMTSGTILLTEEASFFAPISLLHYEYYLEQKDALARLTAQPDLQCWVGPGGLRFGTSQQPSLSDYADGVDTLHFLNKEMLNWHS